jgi:hypothetical protein
LIRLSRKADQRSALRELRADDVNPDVVGRKVLAAIRQMEVELQAGALLTIDSNRARIRLLPLVRRD